MSRRAWGEGSIFQRPDGRWVGRLELEPGPDGKRRRHVVYGRTKREVRSKLDHARAELLDGTEPTPAARARITVGQVLDEYLAATCAPGSNVKPLTRERYRIAAETQLRPHLGRLPMQRLDGDRVAAWQDALLEAGYAPRSVWKARTVLSGVIRLARRKRPPLLRDNPLELVDPPGASKPNKRALSDDESRRLFASVRGQPIELLMLTMLTLGLRPAETTGLRWGDVDFAERTLSVRLQAQRWPGVSGLQLVEPKSAAGVRVVPLPSFLLERLWQAYQAVNPEADLFRISQDWRARPVFPSSTGTHMEPRNLNRVFAAAADRAGIGHLTPHELRHSASTILQSVLGVPPLVVAQLLGHADPAVTLRSYGHVVPEAHRVAMAHMDGFLRGLFPELGYKLGYRAALSDGLSQAN